MRCPEVQGYLSRRWTRKNFVLAPAGVLQRAVAPCSTRGRGEGGSLGVDRLARLIHFCTRPCITGGFRRVRPLVREMRSGCDLSSGRQMGDLVLTSLAVLYRCVTSRVPGRHL